MPYFLYILQMSNGRLYVGTTSNLDQRWERHAHHEAARTTSVLGVEKLVYSETHPDRGIGEPGIGMESPRTKAWLPKS